MVKKIAVSSFTFLAVTVFIGLVFRPQLTNRNPLDFTQFEINRIPNTGVELVEEEIIDQLVVWLKETQNVTKKPIEGLLYSERRLENGNFPMIRLPVENTNLDIYLFTPRVMEIPYVYVRLNSYTHRNGERRVRSEGYYGYNPKVQYFVEEFTYLTWKYYYLDVDEMMEKIRATIEYIENEEYEKLEVYQIYFK